MEDKELDEFKLFTLTELESILGLSHRTLLRYIKEGKLRATKPSGSGKWKVTIADIRKFLSGE